MRTHYDYFITLRLRLYGRRIPGITMNFTAQSGYGTDYSFIVGRSSKFGPVGPNGSKRLWDSPYARGRCPCIFSVRRTAAACELPPNNSLRFVETYNV